MVIIRQVSSLLCSLAISIESLLLITALIDWKSYQDCILRSYVGEPHLSAELVSAEGIVGTSHANLGIDR